MFSLHLLKFAYRVASIVVNGLGISLQNARGGVADHLSNEEVRDFSGAQATSVRRMD